MVAVSVFGMMYAKDPKGFSDAFASPEGLSAYVKQYAEDPEFSAYFDGPSGLNALVSAYAADPEKHPISAQGLENADVKNRGDGVDKLDAAEIQKYAAGIISRLN